MALSLKAQEAIRRAVTDDIAKDEIVEAIDSGSNPQAAAVAALGATVDIGTTDGSGGAGDAALAADTESRLDAIEAKIDAVISALKTAGLMAS